MADETVIAGILMALNKIADAQERQAKAAEEGAKVLQKIEMQLQLAARKN
jgi:hypothetical protein